MLDSDKIQAHFALRQRLRRTVVTIFLQEGALRGISSIGDGIRFESAQGKAVFLNRRIDADVIAQVDTATSNLGAAATSQPVSITVAGPNRAPTVQLTSPAGGSSYSAPASITVSASASDSDGSVAKVEFFAGANKIGESLATMWEIGTSRMRAKPFFRPALMAARQAALTVMANGFKRIIGKYAA